MISPAAITPRRSSGVAIDIAAALESLSFLESRGVDGITLLGSTGEFLHFESEDRARFAAMAVKRCRVPIIVNVSHSAFEGAVELAQQAFDSGAAAVLLSPPYYFRYSQDSLRAWFLDFAAAVTGSVYLYNIPQFSTGIATATALDLLATGAFAGIKDSSGNWENFEALQKAGHRVFLGADTMYARAVRAGAYGAISGTAAVLPELMVALDHCVRAGQDTSALEARVAEFAAQMNAFPFPVALREAALLRGLKPGPHACPPGPAERDRLRDFREWFQAWLKNDPCVGS